MSGASGYFGISGSHTYARAGTYSVEVQTSYGATTVDVYGTAYVTVPPTQAVGVTLSASPGSAFSGMVATFSANGVGALPGEYNATINWGDGTPTYAPNGQGTVIVSGNGFAVTGTHTYATIGHYVTTVQITTGSGASATATGSANVASCPSAPAPSDAYGKAVLAGGPLGYWRLDDASPTSCVLDASGHNLDGVGGGGVTAGQPGALGSNPDTALGFNGSTGYVSLGDPSALQPQQVSVEAWVNTTSTPGSLNTIVRKRGYGYDLYLNQNGKPSFNIIDSNVNVYTVTGAGSVADGHWHYLVGTYNGSQVCLYVDGVAAGACHAAGAIYYSSDMVAIGRDGGYAGNYFTGRIDEVAIYGRALTAAEVQGHYTVGSCPAAPAPSDAYGKAVLAGGPLGYWRLDDASPAACVLDASGHNLDGLAGGGVTANQPGALGNNPDAALGFNGTTGYVSLGDPTVLQPQQVSVEAWVNTTSTPGSLNTIVRKRGYGYDLYVNQNGKPSFNIIDSNVNVYTVTGPGSVADGHWHYLVGTYNGSQVCLYVDGVAAGACHAAGAIYYSSDMVAIGRDGGYAGNYFAGRIDEVAIYGRVLTAAEIQGHYTAVGR